MSEEKTAKRERAIALKEMKLLTPFLESEEQAILALITDKVEDIPECIFTTTVRRILEYNMSKHWAESKVDSFAKHLHKLMLDHYVVHEKEDLYTLQDLCIGRCTLMFDNNSDAISFHEFCSRTKNELFINFLLCIRSEGEIDLKPVRQKMQQCDRHLQNAWNKAYNKKMGVKAKPMRNFAFETAYGYPW
jgi:hypothetical protein